MFELSKLGVAWITINYPELSHETMGMGSGLQAKACTPLIIYTIHTVHTIYKMSTPKFLTFDEVVAAAKLEHGVDFVALRFNEATQVVAAYTVCVDSDEPDYVNVAYSGGALFDFGGEEDFYNEEDAPQEAKELFYVHQKELGDGDPSIMGMTSEYVLFAVLPGLQEPDKYPSEAAFASDAARIFKEFWKI